MDIKITGDGSKTVFSSQFNQHYHSIHGAITESERVYIELGLKYISTKFDSAQIFEMGFGTGLNANLTEIFATTNEFKTNYFGIELFPISETYYSLLSPELQKYHLAAWNEKTVFNPFFSFTKLKTDLSQIQFDQKFNLIYFDAFSPDSQIELWSNEIFKKLYDILLPNGALVTYCSKVLVQQNLKAAGFKVEKHKGPPHKREVLRALKF